MILLGERTFNAHRVTQLLQRIVPLLVAMSGVMSLAPAASAGEVEIVDARAERQGADNKRAGHQLWRFSVTLRHADSGWEHYADGWQVVDSQDAVLGDRVLHHPHENEQPFTRSLSDVSLPASTQSVMIRAHDSVHGWAGQRFTVKLGNK